MNAINGYVGSLYDHEIVRYYFMARAGAYRTRRKGSLYRLWKPCEWNGRRVGTTLYCIGTIRSAAAASFPFFRMSKGLTRQAFLHVPALTYLVSRYA